MSWNGNYHFYLIFGARDASIQPWEKDTWLQTIQPLLDKILQASPSYRKTGLSTLQYVPKPNSVYSQVAKFGKLRWDLPSHEKWTLTATDGQRRFCQVEGWTPMRTVCATNDHAPDIYFSIWNERYYPTGKKVAFDCLCVIAVADQLSYHPREEVLLLSHALRAQKTVYRQRNWQGSEASPTAQWEFINCIQDTHVAGIYKPAGEDIHQLDVEDIVFTPYWEVVYSDQTPVVISGGS
ncbi:hypothetical protein [Chitinophaga nivalis]|uniref:Uncharacterized protein n=1 Tax=Chitinophaga nivalis TaxID=2991709 RepID=A0ABT3IM24_9BACT|nr:hypothetical protein [Chitinophaga nivalis]MCW3465297.1 hypothetical protein [Chitinophaga nivalis]MCW3485011.1 hypothetical protein [Chitinophaga nivalis]